MEKERTHATALRLHIEIMMVTLQHSLPDPRSDSPVFCDEMRTLNYLARSSVALEALEHLGLISILLSILDINLLATISKNFEKQITDYDIRFNLQCTAMLSTPKILTILIPKSHGECDDNHRTSFDCRTKTRSKMRMN